VLSTRYGLKTFWSTICFNFSSRSKNSLPQSMAFADDLSQYSEAHPSRLISVPYQWTLDPQYCPVREPPCIATLLAKIHSPTRLSALETGLACTTPKLVSEVTRRVR